MKAWCAAVAILSCSTAASAGTSDWPAYGGAPGGGQYAPQTQISVENVAQLERAWIFRTGDVADLRSATGGTSDEHTPLHVNGTLYSCTPLGKVIALDPAVGTARWVFDPYTGLIDAQPLASICRGVAYWEDDSAPAEMSCRRRIFRGDFNRAGPHLYAVDADTGKPCADFGAGAGHAGYLVLGQLPWGGEGPVFPSSAPMVVGDVVVVGVGVADNLRANAADGYVRAFDVRTGAERWSFNPIPPELSLSTGGGNTWAPFSVDPARRMVFLPTSSPSPDTYGGQRLEQLPLTNAVVALNAENGAVIWSYQTVHHDLFDYDLPAQPILATITHRGARKDVVIQTAKTGFTFVLDRDTGVPVEPIAEVSVPASDVPGESASATQPMPAWPAPFARQQLAREDLFGLTPFDRAWCRARFDEYRYEGMFTPPSLKGSLSFPSALGGGNWGGAAFDPESNTLVVKAENLATVIRLLAKAPQEIQRPTLLQDFLNQPLGGTPYRMEGQIFMSPLGLPCTPPPWGQISAIDLDTGAVKWTVPLGSVSKLGIPAPRAWGSPNVGGPLVTAGGLIFIAATMDSKIRALRLSDGVEVWSANLPAPGMAVPMTYTADGRQFVVIAAGGNARVDTELSDAIVAFALPRK